MVRLELQLRRSKADEWSGVVNETLDSFYSPFYFPSDISFRERLFCVAYTQIIVFGLKRLITLKKVS